MQVGVVVPVSLAVKELRLVSGQQGPRHDSSRIFRSQAPCSAAWWSSRTLQVHCSLLLGRFLSCIRSHELERARLSFLSDLPVWRALTCLACCSQVRPVRTHKATSEMNKFSCAMVALALVCAAQAIGDAGKGCLLGSTLAWTA